MTFKIDEARSITSWHAHMQETGRRVDNGSIPSPMDMQQYEARERQALLKVQVEQVQDSLLKTLSSSGAIAEVSSKEEFDAWSRAFRADWLMAGWSAEHLEEEHAGVVYHSVCIAPKASS